jgi:hypothetical protein
MPGLSNWQPYRTHVQGGLREGNFINGQFVLLSAGPPHLQDISAASVANPLAGGADVVYPIGITQNVAMSQNKAISRIFEIGSERSYFIAGRSVGQLSLSRVLFHGPSLLRVLYAYYATAGADVGTYPIDPLYFSEGTDNPLNYPFIQGEQGSRASDSTKARIKSGLHGVRVPPGFDNFFVNLASDLFAQPIGLLLTLRDNEENNYGSIYLEQCYVPTHSFGVDAQGLIVQESVGIQYERMVPIKSVAVKLVDSILDDPAGAMSY